MKSISIYEPAMCCSTGLCGVSVDPELLRISSIFNKLEKSGIKAERHNLSNSPEKFISNIKINKIINSESLDVLPITMVNDEIVLKGRYPDNNELINLLELTDNFFA